MSQKLSNYINENSTALSAIMQKVKLLESLTLELKNYLPTNLQDHCKVANLRDGILVIQVPNAAVATQLRYQQSDLLQKFRIESKLYSLIAIEVIVRPDCNSL